MGIPRFVRDAVLRAFRFLLNLTTGVLCKLLSGPPEELPPLREKILLHPATELARKIRKREVRSVDVVKAFMNRAKEVQPFINAVVDDVYDEALEAARKIDDLIASGAKSEQEIEAETPLLGVPLSCKEYIGVEGMYFTNGIYSRRGVRADQDADVVKKLKAAGAIIVVKINVPEYSFSWDTTNLLYGTTNNPYDTRRMPGGSSGGEGALIASGASIIGIGSDLGGSLRVPSFMNGIFCLKPTAGVIPDVGTFPPLPDSIAQFYSNLGPMCRYATDLRTMTKIMAPSGKLNLDTPVDLRRIKIYYCEGIDENPLVTPVIPEIKEALRKAVRHFEDKYDVVAEKVHLESLQDSFAIWAHALTDAGMPPAEEVLAEGKGKANLLWEVLKWCVGASSHTSRVLEMGLIFKYFFGESSRKANLKKLRHLKAQFDNILKDNCVFLFPTQPEPAPYHQETLTKIANASYTTIFNALGYPVTQSPMGLCRGLPIGIQAVAKPYADNLTITVAEELEKAFGGWVCPTPIL